MKGRQENSGGLLPKWALAAASALALVAAMPDALAGPKGTNRPISGTCETEVTQQSEPGAIPIVLAVDVACRISHLGLTVGGTSEEFVYPAGAPTGTVLPIFIVVPQITYVAANGDELWSSFSGLGTLDLATGKAQFSGTETFFGGTGRFRNATGTSLTAGEAVGGAGFLTISGTISY